MTNFTFAELPEAERKIILLAPASAASNPKVASPASPPSCGLLLHALLPLLTKSYYLKFPLTQLPAPCNGCGCCNIHFSCSHGDFEQIHNTICRAEIIIIASPVYNLGLPGELKTFIDRLQPYYAAKFIRRNPVDMIPKKAALLLTAGSDGLEAAAIIKRQLEFVSSTINTTIVETVLWNNLDTSKAFSPFLRKKIKKTAELLL